VADFVVTSAQRGASGRTPRLRNPAKSLYLGPFGFQSGHYNHERLHEATGNATPDNLYHDRQREILTHREKIKRLTLQRRKKGNPRNAACRNEEMTHSIQMKKNMDFQTQPARFRRPI
jgi:hypothetical protein